MFLSSAWNNFHAELRNMGKRSFFMRFKKKTKSFVSILLCVVLSMQLALPAFAESGRYLSTKEIKTLVHNTAIEWASLNGENNLTIGKIKQISTADKSVVYEATYYMDNLPYGYAVITFAEGEPVVKQSVISAGAEGLYTELVDVVMENSDYERKDIDIDETVVEISPFHYGLKVENDDNETEIFDNYGEKYDCSRKYASASSIYISSDNWVSSKYKVVESSKVVLEKFSDRSELVSESYIKLFTGRYACAVTALIQIAYMEGLITYNKNIVNAAYKLLWTYTKTETYEIKDGVAYGGTYFDDTVKGFRRFVSALGDNVCLSSTEEEPSVSWIKKQLNKNKSIVFSYGLNVNGEKSRHCISVLGCMDAVKVSSGNKWTYIMVYDGWNGAPSYINYTYADFTDKTMASFAII